MLSLFLNAALAADRTQTEESYWQMWKEWNAKGDRWLPEILNAEEHNTRFEIFKDNVDKITRHNAEGHSWTLGLTPFADMTPEEFKTKVIGNECADNFEKNKKLKRAKAKLRQGRRMVSEGNPSSVDWVAQGKVTPVKNQGSCGSCWSFSTTGSIEARCAIAKNSSPISLSEQELVDCDQVDSGCNGGAMDNGFNYVVQNSGLCEESAYPYEAARGFCQSSTCTHYDAITGHVDVESGSSSALEDAVAKGPVSIAIEADQMSFQLYRGGVFSGDCGEGLDHGVLLVGYNNDASEPYWKIKNSWGSSWGEQGYIRFCKDCDKNNGDGQCGLTLDASYPTC